MRNEKEKTDGKRKRNHKAKRSEVKRECHPFFSSSFLYFILLYSLHIQHPSHPSHT
jgi:hypothetical protein